MAKKTSVLAADVVDNKWRVEADLNTMMQAKEIKADPKRLKAVQELAKKKLAEMEEMTDLSGKDAADGDGND